MGMKYIVWLSCLFLLSCESEADVKLRNKWRLDAYIENTVSLVTNISNPVFFSFNKDSTVIINLDKNTCSGLYIKSSETITLTDFTCSKECCDSTVSTTAFELFTDSIRTFHINGETLKLKGEHGTTMQLSLVK